MSDRTLAVVLASGGLDSCVAAAWANQRYRLAMLHASYGQRTEAKERDCFDRQVAHFQPEASLAVDLPHLAQIGGSSLTDSALAIPEDDAPGVVPSTYVPFRNATLLAVAVAWAEVLGAGRIVIGAVEPDAPGYPDCRPAFFEAAGRVVLPAGGHTLRRLRQLPAAGGGVPRRRRGRPAGPVSGAGKHAACPARPLAREARRGIIPGERKVRRWPSTASRPTRTG